MNSSPTAQQAAHDTQLKVTRGQVESLDESPEALRGLPSVEAARGPHKEGGSHLASKGAIFSWVGWAVLRAWDVGDTAREAGNCVLWDS